MNEEVDGYVPISLSPLCGVGLVGGQGGGQGGGQRGEQGGEQGGGQGGGREGGREWRSNCSHFPWRCPLLLFAAARIANWRESLGIVNCENCWELLRIANWGELRKGNGGRDFYFESALLHADLRETCVGDFRSLSFWFLKKLHNVQCQNNEPNHNSN